MLKDIIRLYHDRLRRRLDDLLLHNSNNKNRDRILKRLVYTNPRYIKPIFNPNNEWCHERILKYMRARVAAQDLEVIQALAGADAAYILDKLYTYGDERKRPLSVAIEECNYEMADALLAAGADVDVEIGYFVPQTLLHVAIRKMDLELIKILIKHNVDTNWHNPLHYASLWGNVYIVKALLAAGANINRLDEKRETPLHSAVSSGNIHIVKALLAAGANRNIKAKNGVTPLHMAAELGHLDIFQALRVAGTDINKQKDNDERLLSIAKKYGRKQIVLAIRTPKQTPLTLACLKGEFNQVEALLARDTNPNEYNKEGETPLHIASETGQLKIVEALLGANANTNVLDKYGETPLHIASKTGQLKMVKALLGAGADTNLKTIYGKTPLEVAMIRNHDKVVKALRESEQTPLSLACLEGDLNKVKALLAAGTDTNEKNKKGETPLYIAAHERHVEIVQALLSVGADKNIKNKNGETPILIAAQKGQNETVRSLLAFDADVTVICGNKTPLWEAAINNHIDVVKNLVKHPGITSKRLQAYATDGELTEEIQSHFQSEYDQRVKAALDDDTCKTKPEDWPECSITRAFIESPAKGPDENIYESSAIYEWVKKRGTSPLTRQKMNVNQLSVDFVTADKIDKLREKVDNYYKEKMTCKWSEEYAQLKGEILKTHPVQEPKILKQSEVKSTQSNAETNASTRVNHGFFKGDIKQSNPRKIQSIKIRSL